MSHNNGNDGGDHKHERKESKSERAEQKAENKTRSEAATGIQDLTEKTIQERAAKKASGKSGVTGWGENGGLSSAESLIGHINKAEKRKDGSVLLKVNEPIDQRQPGEKLNDFLQAATKRATDPEGWKTWAQSEINKFSGVWEGLNEAKEETKSAAAAGWKAMTDGSVVRFLSHPNAINEPLFKTVSNVFDAMGKDPNATNKALESLGNAVVKASDDYSKMPDHEKGKVWGKAMFAMINPEGSTEGAEAALKIADRVATHIDKAVMDTVQETLKSITEAAPEVAAQSKQMLYDYLKSKGLTGPELEYAGVPKGYFDEMSKAPGPSKDDNVLAMSNKADGLGGETGGFKGGGMDSTGKALSFSQESGIELGAVRQGQDKVWEQAPFPRGDDIHVGLGENLPSGTKTIDRLVFKDGIVESQKSIDLTAPSYESPQKLESKLTDYVHKLETYKGQLKERAGLRLREDRIESKILHVGINDGSMTAEQKAVFEKVGKAVQNYNENLPAGKAPIKLKVTVVK